MKQKLWVKVMVWILTILMIGSCALVLLVNLFGASAAEPDPEYVTVGLMYGSDVTVGFDTVSTVGFSVQSTVSGKTERFSEEIYTIEIPKVTVVCDDNLSKSAYTYSIYQNGKTCVVGGWNLEIKRDLETREEAEEMLTAVQKVLKADGCDMHPFLTYVNGVYRVRAGDYSSAERVENHAAKAPTLTESVETHIVGPSATGVTVLDPETNTILFEYDDGDRSSLGLSALPQDGEKQYLKTPANRLYDGIFLYSRYQSDGVDGIQLINMLPLEDYIAGVVPYEINPSWPYEALRAFSITVRGYTVKSKNRHSGNGFDLCNTTHCQVYRGISESYETVREAVQSTESMILAYEDTVAATYYSSSTGGCTVSSKETWGGNDSPYLIAVSTPWECYSEYNNGLWTYEVGAAELADYLRAKGYTTLTGKKITDIKINSCAENSSYVYSITFTDSAGNRVTVERCDKVRSAVSAYVKSGNFVVGKGSVTYTYHTVSSIHMDHPVSFTTGNYAPLTSLKNTVLSALGLAEAEERRTTVLTAEGTVRTETDELYVADRESCTFAGIDGVPGVMLREVTETVNASGTDSFIFAGMGWGHGVGISQYGTKDLAEAGASAEEILNLYFPMLTIRNRNELDP